MWDAYETADCVISDLPRLMQIEGEASVTKLGEEGLRQQLDMDQIITLEDNVFLDEYERIHGRFNKEEEVMRVVRNHRNVGGL